MNNVVPPGYKQTEVGVIPEEWEFRIIDGLIEDKTILGHLDGNHGELYPRSSEFKEYVSHISEQTTFLMVLSVSTGASI